MARTLPWTLDRAPPSKKPRLTPKPRLKQETLPSPLRKEESDDDVTPGGRGRVAHVNGKAKANRRTPSSSPVRAPPTVELMREGFDGDDVYIMVEDEFQTVAQTYTAHLHAAEYKRLTRQARDAAPKSLPEPTSPMSKQTKNRLRTAALEQRQKEALRQVTNSRSDEEGDTAADLWSGTSLAPLLASGSQKKRSLIGLEGIASTTKAGLLGISRSQVSRKESDKVEEAAEDLDLEPVQHNMPLQPKKGPLQPPSSRTGGASSLQQTDKKLPLADEMIENDAPARKGAVTSHNPDERPAAKRKFFLDFDDGFDVLPGTNQPAKDTQTPRSAPLTNGRNASKRKGASEKGKKSRLDEVPLFIN